MAQQGILEAMNTAATDRLQDWPARLDAYVEAHRKTCFAWGAHDCVTFAAGAIAAITGSDPLQGLTWGSAGGALRQLELEGGILAAVTRRLGDPIPPAMCQRGDLLLMPMDFTSGEVSRESLAVCLGHCCAAPGRVALQFMPCTSALYGWPVGREVERHIVTSPPSAVPDLVAGLPGL
jgi:hypothetical protein